MAFRILDRSAMLKGNHTEAEAFRERAREILGRRFQSDTYQQLVQLTFEAYTAELAKEFSLALGLYEKALPAWTALWGKDHPETITVAYGIAKCALGSGDRERALDAYLDYLPAKRSFLGSEALRLGQDDLRSFWKTSSEGIIDAPLYAGIAADIRPEALGALLDAVMLSKSFNRETIRSFRKQVELAADPVLDSIYVEFLDSRTNLASFDRALSTRLENEIIARLAQKGMVSNGPLMPSWEESRNKLSVKSIAVEFTADGAFVYKNGDVRPAYVSLPQTLSVTPGTPPSNEELSAFYSQIWKPLEPYIQKADTVFFAPAGETHLLPLEALTDSTGVPFRNLHQLVVRLVSTADIPRLGLKPDIQEYILFGDMEYGSPEAGRAYGFLAQVPNLIGSAIEMDELSRILEHKPNRIFRKKDATEETFRRIAFDPQAPVLLHFSTHGIFFTYGQALSMMFYDDNYPADILEENPMLRTVMMMSGAYDQWAAKHHNPLYDATISAQEISEMDLRGVSLAVLAACQTALGDSSPEGLLGFPYAFKLAGAGGTVGTLWSVSDRATVQMMSVFYLKLLDGASPEEALRDASDYIRAQPEFSDPLYWAPFIIVR